MFKLESRSGNVHVVRNQQGTREIAPVEFTWQTGQIGRTWGEIGGCVDRNYAKVEGLL